MCTVYSVHCTHATIHCTHIKNTWAVHSNSNHMDIKINSFLDKHRFSEYFSISKLYISIYSECLTYVLQTGKSNVQRFAYTLTWCTHASEQLELKSQSPRVTIQPV